LDDSAKLGDLFEAMRIRNSEQLLAFLRHRLTIDPTSIPEFFKIWFDQPWAKYYTLNIDDLEEAASRQFQVRRRLQGVSATARIQRVTPAARTRATILEVVHLNGMISDGVDSLTFSPTQYAERISRQEPWYSKCAVDVLHRPVVFVGTELDEVPLWQHVELRRRSFSHETIDRRPASILVAPDLSPPRRDLLRNFRVEWYQGTAEQFAEEVLSQLGPETEQGLARLGQRPAVSATTLHLVSELSAVPKTDTEYLRGEEPNWSDFVAGRVASRSHHPTLFEVVKERLKADGAVVALTGTAGSGKSTDLMNLSLQLSADGVPVLWWDRDTEMTLPEIAKAVRLFRGEVVVAMDDADLLGAELLRTFRDFVPGRPGLVFVFACRGSRLDELRGRAPSAWGVEVTELPTPALSNPDIDGLIEVLDRFNRLGQLTGLAPARRRSEFARYAGRQLLVAMIHATSGKSLEEKAEEEWDQLTDIQKEVYGVVCVASSHRHFLLRDEIALAVGREGDPVGALDRLHTLHLVAASPPDYKYRARHRVIADVVVNKMEQEHALASALAGLAWAAATKVSAALPRAAREWRLLIRIMNHAYLARVLALEEARAVYRDLESALGRDHHYWLQRGSLELEIGDLDLAEHSLVTARSLADEDFWVQTAYSYMLMRKANVDPSAPLAGGLLEEGIRGLEVVIANRGPITPHPYHVLGKECLRWCQHVGVTLTAKEGLLRQALSVVADGSGLHPRNEELWQLKREIERAILMTSVRKPPSESP